MPKSGKVGDLERFRLDNGLRVVVQPDPSSQLVGVAVVYDVGFRSEPEGRTGFAHLFEHMMFQGSEHVGKAEHMRLVESAGGVFNGHTMADLTAYYEALPSSGLEMALYLEAERMGSLAVTEENLSNQVSVVKEEIKVNVLNQPYGGFPFIVLPELAFDTFQNSHNGYGAFDDLDVATVGDALSFYRSFYRPANAVLVVAGECTPDEVARLAERYFGEVAAGPVPAHGAVAEPPLVKARRRVVSDKSAPQPAFVAGYRTPDPVSMTREHLAFVALARILTSGEASRLRRRLVHEERIVTDVSCQLGVFGMDDFFMRDPVLFQVVVTHPGIETAGQIISRVKEELSRLASKGPDEAELERVVAGFASAHWRGLDSVMERAVALSSIEVIHDRAELLSELPALLSEVGVEDVAAAAGGILSEHPAVVEVKPAARRGETR